MNLNRRKKIVLVIIGILFAISPTIISILNFGDVNNLDNDYIKGKIHIVGNFGWMAFRAAGNCKGSGTFFDPYVIEDLVIDGEGSNCILIENSTIFFRIENCTTFNSVKYSYRAGIFLLNVINSKLINNICFSNYRGIELKYSCNNILLGNTAINNTYGIYLSESNNNYISSNEASNNYGIYLSKSNNNYISSNEASNGFEGIYLFYSEYNTIYRNIANDNYWAGIAFLQSNHNNISGNSLSKNDYTGIYLSDSYNNKLSDNVIIEGGITISAATYIHYYHKIDTTNLVNGKIIYYYIDKQNLDQNDIWNAGQIILVNCSNIVISNLEISNCGVAILLYRCEFAIISKNIVNNNARGISIRSCNNITISNNTANNNSNDGIFLTQSRNNTIKNNSVKSNIYRGIYLYAGNENNFIFRNNVEDNEDNGIYLWRCNNNVIKENSVINNGRGIHLYDSTINLVYSNCLNNPINAVDNINMLDEVFNDWDNGTIGNYWADYTGLDSDGNGIGDTPYYISGYAESQDNFPLMTCSISA